MERKLPPLFDVLAGLGAPVTHYKVCSTFDSAPHIGSIGRAIELGGAASRRRWHPLAGRGAGDGPLPGLRQPVRHRGRHGYRLDRHPTMSRHPVTPMDEADLGRHLARQTARRSAWSTSSRWPRAVRTSRSRKRARRRRRDRLPRRARPGALVEAGRLIWEQRGRPALRRRLAGRRVRADRLLASGRPDPRQQAEQSLSAVKRIACVSGSCSPVTAGQIDRAAQHGFDIVRLDAARAVDERHGRGNRSRRRKGLPHSAGRDPLLITAAGRTIRRSARSTRRSRQRRNDGHGERPDRRRPRPALDRSCKPHSSRAIIAGGDTSGHALQAWASTR